MSGECDACNEHCLECNCSSSIRTTKTIFPSLFKKKWNLKKWLRSFVSGWDEIMEGRIRSDIHSAIIRLEDIHDTLDAIKSLLASASIKERKTKTYPYKREEK